MKKKSIVALAALISVAIASFAPLNCTAASTTNKIALFNDLSKTVKFVDDPTLNVGRVSDAIGKYFESYSNYKKEINSVDVNGNKVSAPYDWGLASNVSIDKTVTKNGRPSIKIVNDKPATKDLYFINDSPTAASKGQYRSQFGTYMWLEPNTTYEFNCSMIVEDFKLTNPFSADVTLGARLRVRLFHAAAGNEKYGSFDLTDQGKYCVQESCSNVVKSNKGNAAKGEWYTPEEPLVIKTGEDRYFAQVDVTLWGASGTAYFNDIYAIVSGDKNPYSSSPAATSTPAASSAPTASSKPSASSSKTESASESTAVVSSNADESNITVESETDVSAAVESDDPAASNTDVSEAPANGTDAEKGGFPWWLVWTIVAIVVIGGGTAAAVIVLNKKNKQ